MTRHAAIADPAGFVDDFPHGTRIIDEIQRLPELSFAIKASIDRDRRPGRFLLTGSRRALERIPGFTTGLTRAAYIGLCATGSYPEAQGLPLRLANQWRDNYLDSIVRNDLPEPQKSVSSERVFSILRLLAGSQPNELVRSRLAEDSAIPASTVVAYLDLISDVQSYKPLSPWTPNPRAREVNRPKIVVLDS